MLRLYVKKVKTVIVSEKNYQKNNKIEDLQAFEIKALTWWKLTAYTGGVTNYPL